MQIQKIILGSQSPRRREYIQYLGYLVETISPNVDEIYPHDLEIEKVPEYLAELKADSLNITIKKGDVLITSDTIVILDNEIIGKPNDAEDAIKMLSKLSGRTHQVISGVCIKSDCKRLVFSVSTLVTFSHLSPEEISRYVKEYQPMDKAGSYGIQEYIGFVGVSSIQGSYMNVIGLPLAQIREKLIEL